MFCIILEEPRNVNRQLPKIKAVKLASQGEAPLVGITELRPHNKTPRLHMSRGGGFIIPANLSEKLFSVSLLPAYSPAISGATIDSSSSYVTEPTVL